MMLISVLFFLFFTATSLTAPTVHPTSVTPPPDDPVRVDLPVYRLQESVSDEKINLSLEAENHPAVQTIQNLSTDNKLAFAAKQVDSAPSVFQTTPLTREVAHLENEGWGSKILSTKENLQDILAGVYMPRAIVDTVMEHEKYGNNGDKFAGVGRALVRGAESVSNFVNRVLEVPVRVFRVFSKMSSEKLNKLGGILIGL